MAQDGEPGVGRHEAGLAGVYGVAFPLRFFSHKEPVTVDDNRARLRKRGFLRHHSDRRGKDLLIIRPARLREPVSNIDPYTLNRHGVSPYCLIRKDGFPVLEEASQTHAHFLSYYFYLQILSRSIILLVFLDAVKMNTQGIVIMRNVVRTTKLAEVRSTGFTPMRKR